MEDLGQSQCMLLRMHLSRVMTSRDPAKPCKTTCVTLAKPSVRPNAFRLKTLPTPVSLGTKG